MGIFNKDPVKRLDEDELRFVYLDSKVMEKRFTFFLMIISAGISIAIISFSISDKIYWILIFALLSILWFIYLITKLSRVIEEIFENREVEE